MRVQLPRANPDIKEMCEHVNSATLLTAFVWKLVSFRKHVIYFNL